MKRVLLTLALLPLLLASCTDKYVLTGSSSQNMHDGYVAYIKQYNNGKYETLDSCKIVHGKFKMTGVVDSIMCVHLFMGKSQNSIPVVLEYGDINIDFSDMAVKIEGTPLNDRLYKFLSSRDSLFMRLAELPLQRNNMILDGYDLDDIMKELHAEEQLVKRSLSVLEKRFVMDNFDNVLGLTWFLQLCNEASSICGYPNTTPLIEEIFISAPEEFKEHPDIRLFMKQVDDAMMGNLPHEENKDTQEVPVKNEVVPDLYNAGY